MDKCRKWLLGAAHLLFCLMMGAICLVTFLIDKKLQNNPFPNAVKAPNWICYVLAAVLLVLLLLAGRRAGSGKKSLPERGFFLLLAGIGAAVLLLQLPVMLWAPPAMSSDFGYVTDMAVRLAKGESFAGHSYFVKSTNNVNITILLSWLYRLCGSWRTVICLGAALANGSALLAAFAVYRAGGGRMAALVVCLAGELLAAFSYRAYIPYTDVYGMPFAAGMMALFCSHVRRERKLPALVLLGFAGAWVKITLIIPLLAMLIVLLLQAERPFRKALTRRNLVTAAVLVLVLAAGVKGSSLLKTHYGATTSENTLGWQYMFMAGQDNSSLGQATGRDYRNAWKKIRKEYGSRGERMQACRETALSWIRARGLAGNAKFYLKKLDVAYDDGQFHDVRPYKKDEVAHNLVYQIYHPSGRFYDAAAFLKQVVWDLVLLLLAAAIPLTVFRKGRQEGQASLRMVPEITILGVILYMLLFEGRSKYLFMFLPVYLTLAGIHFGRMAGSLSGDR